MHRVFRIYLCQNKNVYFLLKCLELKAVQALKISLKLEIIFTQRVPVANIAIGRGSNGQTCKVITQYWNSSIIEKST
jgi:hypothetical protein